MCSDWNLHTHQPSKRSISTGHLLPPTNKTYNIEPDTQNNQLYNQQTRNSTYHKLTIISKGHLLPPRRDPLAHGRPAQPRLRSDTSSDDNNDSNTNDDDNNDDDNDNDDNNDNNNDSNNSNNDTTNTNNARELTQAAAAFPPNKVKYSNTARTISNKQ